MTRWDPFLEKILGRTTLSHFHEDMRNGQGIAFLNLTPRQNETIVPVNTNFPAIDQIWVSGELIFGVQAHVSTHDDIMDDFVANARVLAKWFEKLKRIELLLFQPRRTKEQSGLGTCTATDL